MLLEEMTAVATDISTNLRFTPSTGLAIQDMLDQTKAFSERYFRFFHDPKMTSGSGMSTRLSATVLMLNSDREINRGHVTEAAGMLDEALTSVEDLDRKLKGQSNGTGAWIGRILGTVLPLPAPPRRDWIPLTRADILMRRAVAKRMSGDFALAGMDLATAESALTTFIEKPSAQGVEVDELTDDLVEKSKQRLASLYSSWIDLELHYGQVNAVAAERDYAKLKLLIEASLPANFRQGDSNMPCDGLTLAFWCSQSRYQLPLQWADVRAVRKDYDAAIEKYVDVIKHYDAVRQKQHQEVLAELRSYYYRYRLGQLLALRDRESDAQEASTNMMEAADYYAVLQQRDDNAWWEIVHARIERALGLVERQLKHPAAMKSAFSAAAEDDAKLRKLDPANRAFLQDFNQDHEAAAALNDAVPLPPGLNLTRLGAS
jgi:hypothetical protein